MIIQALNDQADHYSIEIIHRSNCSIKGNYSGWGRLIINFIVLKVT